MKKTFYYFLLFAGSTSLFAQTLVGTSVEQKKPLLEKFTGVNCGFCPDGDQIIQTLQTQYGDDITVFAHHTFGQATPDYEAEFSEGIASQSIATGYPAGSVNRFEYPDWQQNPGGTAMGRGNWANAVAAEAVKQAYVNIGGKLRHDVANGKFIIDVELYYTGDPVGDQMLNVALVQNHILGPQAGGNQGNNYEHNHMLRELITGQWGELLPTAANGELIEWSQEVTIPAAYGPVPVVPEDMELVVFVTEGTQVVANSNHAEVEPFLYHELNPAIADNGISVCGTDFEPVIKLTNFGTSNLTDVDFTYTVNGASYTHSWSGDLASLEAEDIVLPAVSYTSLATNTFTAEVTNTNNQGADEDASNNNISIEFGQSELFNANSHLTLKLDGYGSQISWKILDEDGDEYYAGGPYTDGNIDIINESFDLSDDKCYQFVITDTGGDGLVGGQNSSGTYYPPGYYKFMSGSYTLQETAFGNRGEQFFNIDMQTIGTTEIELNKIKIFPNPTSHSFEVDLGMQSSGDIIYSLTDMLGKDVVIHVVDGQGGKNGIIIDHDLPSGVYHLHVTVDGETRYAKVVVQ